MNGRWLNLWTSAPVLCMGFFPKIFGDPKRIDLHVFPPIRFVTFLMQFPVMPSTQRYGELIANFQANAMRLCKSQMMRVTRLSSADKTRLRGDELEMRLVTQPLGLGNGELGLVDPIRSRMKPARDERRS